MIIYCIYSKFYIALIFDHKNWLHKMWTTDVNFFRFILLKNVGQTQMAAIRSTYFPLSRDVTFGEMLKSKEMNRLFGKGEICRKNVHYPLKRFHYKWRHYHISNKSMRNLESRKNSMIEKALIKLGLSSLIKPISEIGIL